MRFKIQYGNEDVNERYVHLNSTKIQFCTMFTEFYLLFCKRSRMIKGISEVDPIRWSGSKWKSLLVGLRNAERHYLQAALQYFR